MRARNCPHDRKSADRKLAILAREVVYEVGARAVVLAAGTWQPPA
jgi:hypothetical protein